MDPIVGAAANIINPTLAERAQFAREQQVRDSERQTDQVRPRPQDLDSASVGGPQALRDGTGLVPAVRPAELTSNAQFALTNEAAANATAANTAVNQQVEGVPGDSDPLAADASRPLAFQTEPGAAPDDRDPAQVALDARTDLAARESGNDPVERASDQADIAPALPLDRGDGATARDALRDSPASLNDLDPASRPSETASSGDDAAQRAEDAQRDPALTAEQRDQFERLNETVVFLQNQEPAERAEQAREDAPREREVGNLNAEPADTASEDFDARIAEEGVSPGGNGGPAGPTIPRGSTLSLVA